MYEEIKNDLKSIMSSHRYKHSIRVAEEARRLADIYHVDRNKAYLAGLLHDIAKEFSDEENMYIIDKYNLSKNLGDKKIIHALIGAYYAKLKYDIDDEVMRAIEYHTIGNINMGLLEKIVYVADKIEPGKKYIGIEEERRLANIDIDQAMILCIENNIKKLEMENKVINNSIRELLLFLKNNSS